MWDCNSSINKNNSGEQKRGSEVVVTVESSLFTYQRDLKTIDRFLGNGRLTPIEY